MPELVKHLALDQLEDLHQSTTPGPWTAKLIWSPGAVTDASGRHPACYWIEHDGWIDLDDEGLYATKGDAEFIAEAHRQWPALISEIRRLRGELALLAERFNAAAIPAPAGRCPDCGGSTQRRRVSEEGEILEGCVCDGPYGEPTWAGV